MRSANELLNELLPRLRRPPRQSLSEWTASNRIISSEESSTPGFWDPDYLPYQAGIMDAISDPKNEKIVMMCSTRVGKTFIATSAIGYYSDLDPSPILVLKPRGEDCNSYSKQELTWLFSNTSSLEDALSANEGKVSTNTLHLKQLNSGGSIRLVGSNSPAALSGYAARIVLQDEVDKYEPLLGFGNPSELADGRSATFPYNRKLIYLSSPTTAHTQFSSRKTIHSLFLDSSQAYFHVPCPSCGHFQPIQWEDIVYAHCPDTLIDVYLLCNNCHYHIHEHERMDAVRRGKWVETNPDHPIKGFTISQLYAPFVTLSGVCREWIMVDKSNNIHSIQRFKNEVLGLPWFDDIEATDSSSALYSRRESLEIVPLAASTLTMAVDVQDSWLSYTITAWGVGRECWVIASGEIAGDPATPGPWEALNRIIHTRYRHAHGITLPISKVLIDTQGHKTTHVNAFLKGKGPLVQGIYGARTPNKPIITRSKRDQHTGLRKWEIGTENAKTDVLSMLLTPIPGEGYIHFSKTLDEAYFAQLYSERLVNGRYKKIGQRRNEKLDEMVYNLAAYYILTKEYTMEQRMERLLLEAGVQEAEILTSEGGEIFDEPAEVEDTEIDVLNEVKGNKPAAPVTAPVKPPPPPPVSLSAKEKYLAKMKAKKAFSASTWDNSLNLP